MRPLTEQVFRNYNISVSTTPLPILDGASVNDLYTSMIIDPISTAANSVFFGDGSVTITNGLEIRAGLPLTLALSQSRQFYELQHLLMKLACVDGQEDLPFIVWNPANMYLIAAAATDVRIVLFKTAWV